MSHHEEKDRNEEYAEEAKKAQEEQHEAAEKEHKRLLQVAADNDTYTPEGIDMRSEHDAIAKLRGKDADPIEEDDGEQKSAAMVTPDEIAAKRNLEGAATAEKEAARERKLKAAQKKDDKKSDKPKEDKVDVERNPAQREGPQRGAQGRELG